MKITSAELIISAAKDHQFPGGPFPEVALSGRSNVGKSSFINTLLARKGLARTSQKPGKTQTLNFYFLNDRFHFVDVPGYGYAKVSKKEREAWGRVMESYFTHREQLKGVIQLVDARHKPTEDDIMMYDWLKYHELPVIIVATKVDKIPKGKWDKHVSNIKKELKLHDEDPVILFSSETAYGKDRAWKEITRLLF
ncbi:YihA family ribosome biogenesis GTP-binding protein [Salipaludibacillus agaradhaerens]|uniref:Probable GTP-binding protein EngB n=1 Tax=Salipaludibacillus agaradhaerens TaxID=76935 RepID=A0A9Q4B092_SALAG|nr:ribosome biogenesis GTP-binding protein YihA/YsxC [Salipaludibacillus agaradhaerens]UJW58527.1 YihA family ribosome biogenesis GTP-binding protein [Bacillus sp. A116_S68]MCR6095635.1 YihA family ribosome biogenesis GTP-binding protein [Salipaludibacillus agaradhaerens]MCR6107474.1 YihA family ribosome biogenesis GTP-binding protein [Salipaludibacillus agaradhaerens]MCR6114805.1 YihA family ribosome biogenesis GTP-binding protein [Salipaludibacillus agaradhaerens]MCR6119503.1 YihA family rib